MEIQKNISTPLKDGDEFSIAQDKSIDHIVIHMGLKLYDDDKSSNFHVPDGEDVSSTLTDKHYLVLEYNKKVVSGENPLINYPETLVSNVYENKTNFESQKKRICEVNENAANKKIIEKCDKADSSPNKNNKVIYSLRKRKNVSMKDDIYAHSDHYNFSKRRKSVHKRILKCLKCKQKFNGEISLFNHQNNDLKCTFCNSGFCSQNSFEYHKKIYHSDVLEDGMKVNHSEFQKTGEEPNSNVQEQHTFNRILFKCEKCKRIFNEKKEMDQHMSEKQCENNEGFICDSCKKTFTDFSLLKQHIVAHLGNPLKCLDCEQCFSSENLLIDHKCKDLEKFFCGLCNQEFRTDTEVKSHLSQHQGASHKCLSCGKLFSTQDILAEHSARCFPKAKKDSKSSFFDKKRLRIRKENKKICKVCKKCFPDREKLKEHLLAGDCKSQNLRYDCDTCGKKFSRLAKLQIHILNVHHGIIYECEKCNAKFPSEEERDVHRSKKDCKLEEPCSCKVCGKVFAKKDYLKKHEYIHSNVLYKCKFCYCAFMKEKSYRRHVERMNCSKSARKIKLAEFNYKKCRICSSEFDEEELLIHHFAEVHPEENPHRCFCCEMCLPTFADLQHHIHLHNIQKFTCNLCGKPYTSQEGFRKHRLKHKGAEFKCQFCESEFLNESRFKFHVKTCKKNPESGYCPSIDKSKTSKKDERPKQSRQLHWESRIIMKHLRGDPNAAGETPAGKGDGFLISSFFDETDSNESNVRGWFDDYYKTEEDDFAFGLRKDKGPESNVDESDTQKTKVTALKICYETGESDDESSSEESSDNSEDFSEDFPVDYNPKKCRICMITFSQEYELLHHFIKVHPENRAHKCPNCDTECPLFAQLKEHMKTHGIGMGVFNCDNCSKKFKSEKKMKSHNIRCKGLNAVLSDGTNKTETTDPEDYCKRCCKKFQTKCGYRRHKQLCKGRRKINKENKKTEGQPVIHQGDSLPALEQVAKTKIEADSSEKPNVQDGCKDGYVGEPPMDSFPCRLCEKKFQYERGIVMHFKSDHPGHKPLVCHICNMHLADKLKEHLKTHGIGEEFICELCGKRFNQKFLSKIHEMWHQGVEYKCNNCKQKFLNKEKMEKHINEGRCSNRQSLMRLPCDICGKSYRSKFGLSKHYITHTPKELRPVKNRMNCEFCGKWFENNNGLQRHRRIHTGERPFCCRFCSKAFAQEGNCKAHERIHTGESRSRKKKNPTNDPPSYSNNLKPCLYGYVNLEQQ